MASSERLERYRFMPPFRRPVGTAVASRCHENVVDVFDILVTASLPSNTEALRYLSDRRLRSAL